MFRPLFIGIGVQKCASTWIHRILEDHPQVFVSKPKEINFFSYHYHFGFEWYEKHFSAAASGENSPSYFCDSRVPERVFQYDSKMKVIVCLRDPVARIVSHHAHEVRLGHVDEKMPFAQALQNNLMYVEQSLYAKHLGVWLSVFPKEQVLILLQEDIQREPGKIAREVYQFLNVHKEFQSSFLEKKANPSQTPKSEKLEGLFKALANIFRLLGLNNLVKRIKSMPWVNELRQKNMENIHHLLPALTELDIEGLDADFKQDLVNLQKLTDLDFSVWSTWQRCFKSSVEQ